MKSEDRRVTGDKIELKPAPGGTAIIQTGDGKIIINHIDGIDPEIYEALAKKYGVAETAIKGFFRILKKQHVAPVDWDKTLEEIARHYQELQVRIDTLSGDDAEIARLKAEAQSAIDLGAYEQAERLLNEASAQALRVTEELRAMLTNQLLVSAQAKAANGDLQNTQLAYAKAALYYREAASLVPEDAPEIQANYLNEEGMAWWRSGRYQAAVAAFETALSLREKTLDPEHPDIATSLNNLALIYHAQGRYPDTEHLFQRSLAIWKKALGPKHSHVAMSLNNLAALYRDQGRYTDAEPLFQQSLVIQEEALGPQHPHVAMSLNNLAEFYRDQRRYADAEPLLQRSLAIWEKVLVRLQVLILG